MQGGGVDGVVLGRAAVEDGFALEAPPLPGRGLPVEGVDEPVELGVDAGLHLGRALRERVQDLGGDSGDVGDPVHRRLPGDAEAAGELGPQPGVVHRRQRPLIQLQRPGIEGQPPAIR
jgi:hypothetical protein